MKKENYQQNFWLWSKTLTLFTRIARGWTVFIHVFCVFGTIPVFSQCCTFFGFIQASVTCKENTTLRKLILCIITLYNCTIKLKRKMLSTLQAIYPYLNYYQLTTQSAGFRTIVRHVSHIFRTITSSSKDSAFGVSVQAKTYFRIKIIYEIRSPC